ncbi:hypothetical protein GALMADRAFT_138831 [Galerina marginata CBS 339.88]|uniref:Uncharacterized protein n=1 Tax=Galerina marginata (strain CBS 339.88) TaxID=685588 RepID=A0A067TFL1_GALM3|nr:hypothetical protein GALMADRAFT_138831 [Galerina marginata CBS 339.88]
MLWRICVCYSKIVSASSTVQAYDGCSLETACCAVQLSESSATTIIVKATNLVSFIYKPHPYLNRPLDLGSESSSRPASLFSSASSPSLSPPFDSPLRPPM